MCVSQKQRWESEIDENLMGIHWIRSWPLSEFQLALIASLGCKLNEAKKHILKQKVDQSQPDFATLHQGSKTPHLNHWRRSFIGSFDVAKCGRKQRSQKVSYD